MELTSSKRLLVGQTLRLKLLVCPLMEVLNNLAAVGSHSDGFGGYKVVHNVCRPSLETNCAQTIKPQQPCVALPASMGTERFWAT